MSTLTATSVAFTIGARQFAEAIGWVAKHLPHKPTHPVMAGILFYVQNGQVTASAHDYDRAVTATLPVEDDMPGRVLVPGRFLADVTKTFPDQLVSVATNDTTMTVTCGNARLTLPLMPVEDYPAAPTAPPTAGVVSAADLAALITRVGVAADLAGTKGLAFLRGIYLAFGDQLEATSSDRYRVATGVAPWLRSTGGDVDGALVLAGDLIDAAKTFDGPGQVTIGADDSLIRLAVDGRSVITRLVAAAFPVHATRTFFPGRSEQPVTVPTRDLIDALKRADLVRADKTAAVLLSITADGVSVSARASDTPAGTDETVACQYAGEPINVHFNPLYLADALTALRSENAELHIAHPYKPVPITSPTDPDLTYQHTVVPIRVP